MQTKKLLILTGGLILFLGSRIPWIFVAILFGLQGPAYDSIEIGWEDNDLITGGIGLILFLGAIFWRGKAKAGYSIPAAILAVCAVLIVIGCFLSILGVGPPAEFFAGTGIEIYVTFIGSLLSLVGTVGAAMISFRDNQSYRKIIGRVLIMVICLRLLWFLPITHRAVTSLLLRPKEISVPALTAPNAITPETVAGVHLLERWGNGAFRSMAWSPDGRYFAVGTTSGINLYEARTFQLLHYIDIDLPNGYVYPIDKLVFSPDSNSLAASETQGGEVLVIDLASDKILLHWKFDASITALAYLKDGTLVRLMEQGGILKLVNGSWQPTTTFNDDFLYSLALGADRPAVSPDGSLSATIGWSESGTGNLRSLEIRLWNTNSSQPARIISAGASSIYDRHEPLVFSPAGDWLALLASDSTIKIFSTAESQTREVVIKAPFADLTDIAITPQGEIRAVSRTRNMIEVLSLPSGNSIDQWHSDKRIIGYLLDDAGTVAIKGEYDTPMRLYRIGEGKSPEYIWRWRCCSAFSSDGNVGVLSYEYVNSSGDPYILAIWQKNFGFYQEWKFSDTVFSAVSPSGQYVAAVTTLHADKNAPSTYLWVHGIESGRRYPPLPTHIAFSPDEKHLASTQGILDLETGQITATEIVGEDSNYYYDITPAFSPDGQILAADFDGALYFWRVSDGALLAKVDDPNYAWKKLVFSSDGTFLVGLGEGFVNVWGISKINH